MKLIPIAILALLSSAVAQTAMHEAQHAAGSQEAAISLCELIAHPSAYAGKPVTVKATLASGMEFSIFTDDSCQPALDKTKLILAKFSSNQFESPMGKKLSKLLKEKQRAEVTMVGVFTDPGRFVGHQACCRYKLEVRQLLVVEEATAATPDKHGSALAERPTVGLRHRFQLRILFFADFESDGFRAQRRLHSFEVCQTRSSSRATRPPSRVPSVRVSRWLGPAIREQEGVTVRTPSGRGPGG